MLYLKEHFPYTVCLLNCSFMEHYKVCTHLASLKCKRVNNECTFAHHSSSLIVRRPILIHCILVLVAAVCLSFFFFFSLVLGNLTNERPNVCVCVSFGTARGAAAAAVVAVIVILLALPQHGNDDESLTHYVYVVLDFSPTKHTQIIHTQRSHTHTHT